MHYVAFMKVRVNRWFLNELHIATASVCINIFFLFHWLLGAFRLQIPNKRNHSHQSLPRDYFLVYSVVVYVPMNFHTVYFLLVRREWHQISNSNAPCLFASFLNDASSMLDIPCFFSLFGEKCEKEIICQSDPWVYKQRKISICSIPSSQYNLTRNVRLSLHSLPRGQELRSENLQNMFQQEYG